ncbi:MULTISPECIES: hypothetical protein [Mycobacteriaceae]|uniref:Uncharacterized protein n=1 Tax=Mycolicibacterium neoaurum VKM Ac-1815D TaxID=700508 RepID=V5XIF8_MYCNE|nr:MULTISPECIES: hypothetical protein [Mycobacteriaceae]AHC27812.1 hypothetical protein D174_04165 [Mycolicibacterium neoaurum VKM Ac-1815D]AMO04502.1 hypothetical protein MyAD_04080 [Mycolicibacterium neoaurum]AXK77210.1 hypothetical protein DXK33_21045 [Mycolicibacterium neoaurum]KJQ48525.1 hypothetical protein TS71_20660 [Mycolicibacterium neoaurum]KUM06911.1 hypothetical protein AVZ31_18830 [Mycolicibacterium neoaurum]
MTPQEVAEELIREATPDNDVLLSPLRAGVYGAVVLDALEHAATHRIPLRSELLDAIEAAIDDIARDEIDVQSLTEDLAVLRPLWA